MFGTQAGPRAALRKNSHFVAARNYARETMDVIAYLRAPLLNLRPEIAHARIGAVALLESLTLFRHAMEASPFWPQLPVPEPELISVARGGEVGASLTQSLKPWAQALTEPRNHDYWCAGAFLRSNDAINRQYDVVVDRAEAGISLLTVAPPLNAECIQLARRLRDQPLDLMLMENVRDLRVRTSF